MASCFPVDAVRVLASTGYNRSARMGVFGVQYGRPGLSVLVVSNLGVAVFAVLGSGLIGALFAALSILVYVFVLFGRGLFAPWCRILD